MGVKQQVLGACLVVLGIIASLPTADSQTVTLRASTGMVILPSPAPPATEYVKFFNGSRYSGPLNPDSQARPQVQGKYEVLAQQSDVVGVHLVHVPFTDKYLYMERPSAKRSATRQIAGTFDLVSREWYPVNSMDGLFCAGHTITSDGSIAVAGGHKQTGGYPSGMRSVRLFNQFKNPGQLVNETWMQWPRWYPSLTLLPDTTIMIMGGTQQVGGSGGGNKLYEIYDPQNKPTQYPLKAYEVEETFYAQMKKMYYPFNFVLPTGEVFSSGEREARVLVAQTGVYRQSAPGWYRMGIKFDGTNFTQYPYTATPAFGMLSYEDNYGSVTVHIFGGAPLDGTQEFNLLANRWVRSSKITWSNNTNTTTRSTIGPYVYSMTNWTIEDTYIPRVMGDATLLPNGDVILLNGAQIGVAGDGATASGNGGRSDYPNFWAQLYQPDRPVGQRFTMLAGSTIARMYHSTAALTVNGTLLVTGCDRCYRLNSDVKTYVTPTQRWEYRNEIFYPPYFYDTANKPKIASLSSTTVGYNTDIVIQWSSESGSAAVPVTAVTLVAPSSTTHSFNMNQRVIKLRITSIDYNTNTLTVRTPPHPYIAPPQYYMLFALNGKTYSVAKWIKLVDVTGVGKVVPS